MSTLGQLLNDLAKMQEEKKDENVAKFIKYRARGVVFKHMCTKRVCGQMCQGRNPGQIRHGDKTVPCCQLMGAKSKPS